MIDLLSWIDNAHSYLLILRQEVEARGDLDAYPMLPEVIEQYREMRLAAKHAPLAFAVALKEISGSRAAEILGISIQQWREMNGIIYDRVIAMEQTTPTATDSADKSGSAQRDPR